MNTPGTELQDEVEHLVTTTPGTWSVVVSEGEPWVAVDPDRRHRAASTVKLPLLCAALARLDPQHLLDLPSERDADSLLGHLPSVTRLPLAEVLELMVTVSDNVAANAVIDALGGLAGAQAALRADGWAGTALGRRLAPAEPAAADNTTTARDLASGLERLVRGTSTGPLRGAAQARAVLGRQRVADRLPSGLPDDVTCLHKPGELPGVRHDAGVVVVDGREVVVVVLGSDLPDADGDRAQVASARRVAGGVAAAVVRAVRERSAR